MSKRLLVLLVPLLLLAGAYAIPREVPQAHAQADLVCIAETSPADPGAPCAVVPTFTGALTSPVRTQLRVAVFLQDSNPMNGFNMILLADSTRLQPADADLTGSLVGVVLTSPTILAKCIGGVLVQGSACDARALGNPSTIQFAAVGSGITSPPTTGLLFTAVYDIVGTTTTPVTIGYQTGCSGTSVAPDTCITISDGSLTPVPQTVQTANFDNAVQPPFVTLSASPTSIGPIFPGDLSTTSTVTATANNGFDSSSLPTVSLTAACVGPVGLSASIAPGFVDLFGVPSAMSSLTVSVTTAVAPGSYSCTVTGTYQLQDSLTLIISTLSHSVTLPIIVVDYTITASPATVTFWSGQTGTATITVTGQNFPPSFTQTVTVQQLSIVPSTGLVQNGLPGGLQTIATVTLTTAAPTANVALTFSSSTPGSYTVTDRGSAALSTFTRLKNANVMTVRVQDFTLASSASTVTFDSGSTGSATLTLNSLPATTAGFAGNVDLSFTVTPTTPVLGVSFSIDPVTLAAGGTATSVVTFSGTVSTTTTFTVVITGTATIGTQTQTRSVTIMVTVNVVAVADFAVAASPTSVTVVAGNTATSAITVSSVNNFAGTVNLAEDNPNCTIPASVNVPAGGSATASLSCTFPSAGTFTVIVTGTSGSLTPKTATVTFTVTDFAIAADPTSVTLLASATGTSTLTVTSVNGFAGTVSLTHTISPASGLACTLSPASVTLGDSGTSTLSCSGSAGTYTVTVTATSAGLSRTATVAFTVQDFTVTASPTSVTFTQGGSGTSTITVASLNGFAGTVALSSSVDPTGLTCNLNPTSIILGTSETSDLACSGSTLGTFTVTVTGTSGSLSRTATVSFEVVGEPDFNISASPTSITVVAGAEGTSMITVLPVQGFTGTVSLAHSITPSTGLTCTLNPASITGGSGTSTLACSGSAGVYTVTVTGASGLLTHSTTATFAVQDFTVAASPTSVTINAGATGTSTITVTAVNGFTGTVNLDHAISPAAGLSCTLGTTSIILGASGTSTLSCSGSAETYTVTVTGTSGSLSRTATIVFTIRDFTLTADPTTVEVNAGTAGTSIVTVTAINGFTGEVSLESTVAPGTGLTCTLTPTSVTLGTLETSTLSCNGSAGTYIVTITGASGSLTRTATVTFTIQDFTVTASPTTVTVAEGATGSSTITVASVNGFTGTVSLTSTVSPTTGLTCALNPTGIILGASETSMLSCSGSEGTYTVTVTGSSEGLSRSASVTFIVGAPVGFTISASPASVTIVADDTGTSTITASPTGGFTGTIDLVSSVSPSAGLTCTLNPTSITGGSGTSTLSCSGSAGVYAVTVTGTSGSLTQSTTVAFTVQDFTVTASPTSVTVVADAEGTSSITVASVSGFTGTVTLAATVLPATGLTCTLTPDSVTLGISGISTLSCSGSAGDYTVTVSGTSGSLSRTATVAFTVQDFSVAASPTSVTISAGDTGTSTITLTSLNSFAGTVGLVHTIAPATGLTCTLNPASVTLGTSDTSTLSCNGSEGTYTVTVTGTSSGLSRSATVTFNVGPPSGFMLAASPAMVTVAADSTGTSIITVTPAGGFSGTVDLTSTVTPPTGLTCSLDPASVTLGESGTSTLSCTGSAGTYAVTVTGTSGTASSSTIVTFTVTDFTVIASPTSVTFAQGDSGTSVITVASVNGFTGTVDLAATISPVTGLACTLEPTSVILGTSETSSLNCSGSTLGTFTVTVTGTSGSLSRTTTVTFEVVVVDFATSADPTSVSVVADATGTSTITVTSIGGFTGTVTLAHTISPAAGLTCTLSTTSVTLGVSGTSTLSCSGSAGNYAVTVTGTSGQISHFATVDFTVTDFTLEANPTSVTVNAGATGTSTITATAVNGFTGTITLATTVSPSTGLTCSLTPASITLGVSGTSTLECSGSAGPYTVTVTGTSGSLSRTATVTFDVLAAADFTLAASPTSVTVVAGAVGTSIITVESVNGFEGTVSLTATVSPATGLACSLSPTEVALGESGTSTLSCSGSAGTYTVIVTGTSGSLSHTAAVAFTVQDFSISPSTPITVNCNVGDTCTTTVAANSINGFEGIVTLTTNPSLGLTATLASTTLTLTAGGLDSTTLSLSAGASGDYTVTVTGTSGSLSHTTATITLHVTAPPIEAIMLSFDAFDASSFENGVGELDVLVNGQLVINIPAGQLGLTGSGSHDPYDETWVSFGPFDITSKVIPGTNTIVFRNPLDGHSSKVRNVMIVSGDTVFLNVARSRTIDPFTPLVYTFSQPPLVLTSLTVSPSTVFVSEGATLTATYTGGVGPFRCTFRFGDGSTRNVVSNTQSCSATRAYPISGTFVATVRVRGANTGDDAGGTLTVMVHREPQYVGAGLVWMEELHATITQTFTARVANPSIIDLLLRFDLTVKQPNGETDTFTSPSFTLPAGQTREDLVFTYAVQDGPGTYCFSARLKYGVDANSNGVLEDSEILGSRSPRSGCFQVDGNNDD